MIREINDIIKELENLSIKNQNVETWVIKCKGKAIRLPNGKSIWRGKGDASSAFTNFLKEEYNNGYSDWRHLENVRGFDRITELKKYLLDKEIIKIEKI